MMRALLYLLPTAAIGSLLCEWMLQGTRVVEAHTSMAVSRWSNPVMRDPRA